MSNIQHEQSAFWFLLRILQCISLGFGWMILQLWLGMYVGLAYFGEFYLIANIVFYIQFVVTGFLVYRYIRNKWKKPAA